MDKKLKIIIIVLTVILLLAVGLLCSMLVLQDNYLIDWKLYPKDARTLDLRGKTITIEHYENVRKKLPDCEILWDVPFQEGSCPSDATELTLSSLSQADVQVLAYVPGLRNVDATACRDYEALAALKAQYPDCTVSCTIPVDGKEYASDASSIAFDSLSGEDMKLMPLFSNLKEVDARGCEDYANLAALQALFPECSISFDLIFGEETYPSDSTALTLEKKNLQDLLVMLPAMSNLETLSLVDPQGTPEELAQLREALPHVQISWEVDILGVRVRNDMTEADLSGAKGFTLEQVAQAMEWFPEVEQVFLGECGIDNEEIAAFREEKKDDYKVVWTVQCGKLTVRTDDKGFIPVKHHVYYFFDEDCVNLRYCNEMEALDLGHMSIHNVEFLEGMTSLKYLVLAHTFVKDITPVGTCKNLVFLELDFSSVQDFTPLQGCTSLQDLNVGETYADVEPLLKLTWLNNLWCVKRGYTSLQTLKEGMPETVTIFHYGAETVGGGWRKLPNYYAMRDTLGMHYMSQ